VQEERVVRESGMQQLEKDVRAQLMDLEDKVVRVRHSHGLSDVAGPSLLARPC
jgi:hypothetical protein